jgi:hypothetical protein
MTVGYVTVADRVRAGVREVLNKLNKPDYEIHFTGHSLGGSVASFAAMDMSLQMPEIADRIRLYTYGQPRYVHASFSTIVRKLTYTPMVELETRHGPNG